MKGTKGELNKGEQRIVTWLAKAREQYNRSRGIVDQKFSNNSNEAVDRNGLGGEFFFCRIHNVYPDLQYEIIGKPDCWLHDGTNVDVKTAFKEDGRLMVDLPKFKDVDWYALVVGTFPNYTYCGKISRAELIKDHRREIRPDRREVRVATQDELD